MTYSIYLKTIPEQAVNTSNTENNNYSDMFFSYLGSAANAISSQAEIAKTSIAISTQTASNTASRQLEDHLNLQISEESKELFKKAVIYTSTAAMITGSLYYVGALDFLCKYPLASATTTSAGSIPAIIKPYTHHDDAVKSLIGLASKCAAQASVGNLGQLRLKIITIIIPTTPQEATLTQIIEDIMGETTTRIAQEYLYCDSKTAGVIFDFLQQLSEIMRDLT